MGQACSTAAPPQSQGSKNRITVSNMRSTMKKDASGIKSAEAMKKLYKLGGAIDRGCSVTLATAYDCSIEYVCRKLKLDEMPCTDDRVVASHCHEVMALEHPNICKLIECFKDGTYLYALYEKAQPVTLFDHVRSRGSLIEDEAADYVRQVARALSVAHGQGIVHGRLSPRSLILASLDDDEDIEVQLKICDMGQAFVLRPPGMFGAESEKQHEREAYSVSPELACGDLTATSEGSVPHTAHKTDVWSLGIITYHMLSGGLPFDVSGRDDLVHTLAHKRVEYSEAAWASISNEAKEAIETMLKLNPGIRSSAATLLKHPWLRLAKTPFPKRRMMPMLQNLRTNVSESQFKRFVLRVIVHQLPYDGKAIMTVEQAFRCLDRNGDGVLSQEEIVKGLQKHIDISPNELRALFEQVDRDGSGSVSVQEFAAACVDQRRSTSPPVLWQAFSAFDKDSGGIITFDELDQIVMEIEGALVGSDLVDAIRKEIRRDLESVSSSETLDFDQFLLLMRGPGAGAAAGLQKDVSRLCWSAFGLDCHQVRHMPPQETWNLSDPRSKAGTRSAYSRKSTRASARAG